MPNSYVYLLHFDTSPRSRDVHHYAGCTGQIKRRLTAHCHGRGSRLTRELHAKGIPWTLAAVWHVREHSKYAVERHLKDSHNLARYCPVCNPNQAFNPLKATPVDPDNIAFSRSGFNLGETNVRPTAVGESVLTTQFIRKCMSADKNALGFIPVGGSEGLQYLIDRGRILLAFAGNEPAGYIAFTTNANHETLKIQQCCVADEYRLSGIGARLVRSALDLVPNDWTTTCNVAADLPANLFWKAIGFTVVHDFLHPTSGRKLNHHQHNAPTNPNEE